LLENQGQVVVVVAVSTTAVTLVAAVLVGLDLLGLGVHPAVVTAH
jgi:hypothetical protein